MFLIDFYFVFPFLFPFIRKLDGFDWISTNVVDSGDNENVVFNFCSNHSSELMGNVSCSVSQCKYFDFVALF